MYSLIKKILFSFDPETAHELSLDSLGAAERLRLMKLFATEVPNDPLHLMGLTFPNRVGLAAGLDKNGDYFNGLGALGFGFVEIGTVTPLAQEGNAKPRLFRLQSDEAIINRMGFNNKGVAHLVGKVKARRFDGILGINIGKNKDTPEDEALSDYEKCMEAVYPYADYIAVNISSPNTPGLRSLQFGESFERLLKGIKARQKKLAKQHNKYVPLALKIAPDMGEEQLRFIADKLVKHKIDAVVATNTTVTREGLGQSSLRDEMGGLSGKPLRDMSTNVIRTLFSHLNNKIPIIGVGGILHGADAAEKIAAGASLVQIYSGFIYRGPELIGEAVEAVAKQAKTQGIDT